MNNNQHIYVIYIDVRNISDELKEQFSENILNNFKNVFNGIFLTIPHYNDTKIECINPKYITEKELIEENQKLIKEMNEKIKKLINIEINGKEKD